MSLDLISPLAARAASAVAAVLAAPLAALALSGLPVSLAHAEPAKAGVGAAGSAKPPIFVLNSLDASVSIIDPVSFQEIRRVPTGKEPHHLYLSPDEKSLLVANALADSLTLLDPRTGEVQRVITGISDPYQLKFSPDMKWFLTAANRLNHVDIYRSTPRAGGGVDLALAKRVPTGKTPSHIATDSKSSVAYVTMQDSDELVAIDLNTQAIRWRVPVGKMPADVFVTPDDRHLLIGLTGDRAAEVYDVTGAGDTVIAVLALLTVAGAPLVEAAKLANVAAGVVVRKLGNATVTQAELAAAVQQAGLG